MIENNIDLEGAKALSNALKTHTTMDKIWLGGESNECWNDKQQPITKALKTWTDNAIGDEGVKVLCEALKMNTGLIELELQSEE